MSFAGRTSPSAISVSTFSQIDAPSEYSFVSSVRQTSEASYSQRIRSPPVAIQAQNGFRCRVVYAKGKAKYLGANSNGSLIVARKNQFPVVPEWIFSPSAGGYTIQYPVDGRYLSQDSVPRLVNTPVIWKLEKVVQSGGFVSPPVKDQWTCFIRATTPYRDVQLLGINNMSPVLGQLPSLELSGNQWKWHILFLEDRPSSISTAPPVTFAPSLYQNPGVVTSGAETPAFYRHEAVIPESVHPESSAPSISASDIDDDELADESISSPQAETPRASTPQPGTLPKADETDNSNVDVHHSANHIPASSTYSGDKMQCRVQHLLTGKYLVNQARGAGLTDDPDESVWLLESAGPGYTLAMPTDDDQETRYLAPVYDNNQGQVIVHSLEYRATWDFSEGQGRYAENPEVGEIEWVCRIRWPFTGQYIVADSALNYRGKSEEGYNVWMTPVGNAKLSELERLRGYWRIQFLTGDKSQPDAEPLLASLLS